MKSARGGRFRAFSAIMLAPLLVFIALMAWALSSPVGASPDDDFHLVSIWCANPAEDALCQPGSSSMERRVPEALVDSPCYAFEAERSAGCQRTVDFDSDDLVPTARGNFVGGYPPVYYATMNLLAGPDITTSVLLMRTLNVLIFVGLTTAMFLLLPIARRSTLVWSWAITTVPLGLFVLSSNNPSAWAIMGVGTAWLALYGYFESVGWRKISLGVIFALSSLMAAGSRGDAASYVILAIIAVGILTFRATRKYAIEAILPVAIAALCFGLFRFSRPVASLTQGITGKGGTGGGSGGAEAITDPLALLAYNFLDAPSLWTGIFGQQWGLGWLDTSMPAVVWLGCIACFIGTGFVAVGRMSPRKLFVLICGTIVLWLLPTTVLVAAGDTVGENMQPRYLLPLIVLFAGVLMLAPGIRAIQFTRLQTALIATTLSVAHALSLHLNLQRYVLGFDDLGWNIDAGIEWWWELPFSPMFVWIIGSAAYTALMFIVLNRTSGRPVSLAATPQPTASAL